MRARVRPAAGTRGGSLWSLLLALSGLACAVPGGCSREERPAAPATRPNLLLVVVDTLRADALGDVARAPHLDRLAVESAVFRNALALVPATGPSHASLFTGQTPWRHGVRLNSQKLPQEATTLAERLRDEGYETAAVVSLGVLRSQYGFAQGFEFYDEQFPQQWFRLGEEITDHAVAWLRDHTGAPFFLFVHYSDPHEPYGRPDLPYPEFRVLLDGTEVAHGRTDGLRRAVELDLPPGAHDLELVPVRPSERRLLFRGIKDRPPVRIEFGDGWQQPAAKDEGIYSATLPAAFRIINESAETTRSELPIFAKEALSISEAADRYRGEVNYVDAQVGRLLAAVESKGISGQTLVVFTSDHGEALGEHGHLGHINQLYQPLVHVPLMFRLPTAVRPGVRAVYVSHLDVVPTILPLLGLTAPISLPGRDLFGAAAKSERPVVAATFPPLARQNLRSLTLDGFRLIRHGDSGANELFHLAEDPGELRDLSAVEDDRTRRYLSILERFLAQAEESASPLETPKLTEEEHEHLRALGYLQ